MRHARWKAALAVLALGVTAPAFASDGDRLLEFNDCLQVRKQHTSSDTTTTLTYTRFHQTCHQANCREEPTPIRTRRFTSTARPQHH